MVTKKRQAIINQPRLPMEGLGKDLPIKEKKTKPVKDHYDLAKEAVLEGNNSKIRAIVENPNLSSAVRNRIFSDPQIIDNIPHQFIRDQIERDDLHPSVANAILENGSTTRSLRERDLNTVLDKIPSPQRKQYIDRKIGINGGEHTNSQNEIEGITPFGQEARNVSDEQFQKEHNWDNWRLGDESDYDKAITKQLATSKHLDDSQAEHIKRHGTFDQKYALYHNENIDPKHGVEMFQKWHDGDVSHGYDPEELNAKYAEDKDDKITANDIDPEELEIDENDDDGSIRDAAEQSYDFNEYVRDQGINLWDREDPENDEDHDWIDSHLRDEHNWEEDNEDHNPEEAKRLEEIKKLASREGLDQINNSHADIMDKKYPGFKSYLQDNFNLDPEDENSAVDIDDIEDHQAVNNPETIDYANHDEKSIQDHPEYNNRYDDAVDAWRTHRHESGGYPEYAYEGRHYDNYQESQGLQNARNDVLKEMRENAFEERKGEFYSNAHQDERFIPDHLRQHIPNLESLKGKTKKNLDGANKPFLDSKIKNREHTHDYGEDQHFYEMVKDAADANNGSIDVGTMHKMYPNQKEKWKKIFGDKGRLKTDEIDNKIAEIPKTHYDVSYGKWDSNKMQNINGNDQTIFRLDHSDESLKPLQEDPEVYETFKKVIDTSKRSGHPTKDRTIAWSRVDMSDPKHWMVDEVQSDFGKTVREYLKREGHTDKADHIDTIEKYNKNWREALLNKVIAEAKKHGVEKISTHSPESKASHTGAGTTHTVYEDSYKKVPRTMGFKPSKMEDLPLNKKGQREFEKEGDSSSVRAGEHADAMDFHAGRSIAHQDLALRSPAVENIHNQRSQYHENMFNQHLNKVKEFAPEHPKADIHNIADINFNGRDMATHTNMADAEVGYDENASHKYDKLLNQPLKPAENLGGHTLDLTPAIKKNMIDLADSLIKAEILLIKNMNNVDFKQKMLYNIAELRKVLYEN